MKYQKEILRLLENFEIPKRRSRVDDMGDVSWLLANITLCNLNHHDFKELKILLRKELKEAQKGIHYEKEEKR